MQTTVGRILVNSILPKELQSEDLVLDKKGTTALLRRLALEHPEQYREVSHQLADLGRRMASESGGFSASLEHFRKARAAITISSQVREKVRQILDDDRLTDKQRRERIIRVAGAAMSPQSEAVFEESLQERNPLAMQILSGARGNKMNLSSLRGSDLLYSDNQDRVIPVPILRSYSEGLTPAEYWASTYGARKGVVAVKLAVANAGWLGKRLNQVTHRLVVSGLDSQSTEPVDKQPLRGVPVDVDDEDNEGALLASDYGPYKRNTIITSKVAADLAKRRFKRILVRSPMVGGAPDGSLYARDVGVRETGQLPGRGTIAGMSAAQSLAEPVSQGTLGAKHTGGIAGQDKAVSGYKALNASIEAPKTFHGGAAHADLDGTVQKITPAPAGGFHVTIDDVEHYVPQESDLTVEKGDKVEAGDLISSGLPDYNKLVEHKGIGEARRYFSTAYRRAMRASGLTADRRNTELLARGLINHVRLTDEIDDHIPDDVIPYSTLEHSYKPRPGSLQTSPRSALGKYLERPVLHFTIGTKIRQSVLRDLDEFGVKEVTVHHEPPPFVPEMVRASASLSHDPDFMTRMYGSGLKASFLAGVHRGAQSDETGTSFVPGLARSINFGRQGLLQPPELSAEPSLLGTGAGSVSAPAPELAQPAPARGLSRLTHWFKLSAEAPIKPIPSIPPPGGTPPHQWQQQQPPSTTQPSIGQSYAGKASKAYTAAQQQARQPAQTQQIGWSPGFQGGQPLFGYNPDPQMLQRFVGGMPEGLGQASMLLSSLDPYAFGALTSGQPYTRGNYDYHQNIDYDQEMARAQQRNQQAAQPVTIPQSASPAAPSAAPPAAPPAVPSAAQPGGMSWPEIAGYGAASTGAGALTNWLYNRVPALGRFVTGGPGATAAYVNALRNVPVVGAAARGAVGAANAATRGATSVAGGAANVAGRLGAAAGQYASKLPGAQTVTDIASRIGRGTAGGASWLRSAPLVGRALGTAGQVGSLALRGLTPLLGALDAGGVVNAYRQGGMAGGRQAGLQTGQDIRNNLSNLFSTDTPLGQRLMAALGVSTQHFNPVSNVNSIVQGTGQMAEDVGQAGALHGALRPAGAREMRLYQQTPSGAQVGPHPVNTNAAGRRLGPTGAVVGPQTPAAAPGSPERTSLLGSLLSPEERRMEGVLAQQQAYGTELDRRWYGNLYPTWQRYQQWNRGPQNANVPNTGWIDPVSGHRLTPQEFQRMQTLHSRYGHLWNPDTSYSGVGQSGDY